MNNALRTYFVVDEATGSLRLTNTGQQRLRERFARQGVDVHTIKTREDLRVAWEWVMTQELIEAAQSCADPEIDAIFGDIPAWREGMRRR